MEARPPLYPVEARTMRQMAQQGDVEATPPSPASPPPLLLLLVLWQSRLAPLP